MLGVGSEVMRNCAKEVVNFSSLLFGKFELGGGKKNKRKRCCEDDERTKWREKLS